jgi:hypothetical protein
VEDLFLPARCPASGPVSGRGCWLLLSAFRSAGPCKRPTSQPLSSWEGACQLQREIPGSPVVSNTRELSGSALTRQSTCASFAHGRRPVEPGLIGNRPRRLSAATPALSGVTATQNLERRFLDHRRACDSPHMPTVCRSHASYTYHISTPCRRGNVTWLRKNHRVTTSPSTPAARNSGGSSCDAWHQAFGGCVISSPAVVRPLPLPWA